jgi:hypothetical protein
VSPINYNGFIAKLTGEQSSTPAMPSPQGQFAPNNLPDHSDEMSYDKNVLAEKLERVTEKAIDKTEEILRLELPDPDHTSFGAVLRAQNAAANTVLNTQVKVDENRLRKQQFEITPAMVAEWDEWEAAQPWPSDVEVGG